VETRQKLTPRFPEAGESHPALLDRLPWGSSAEAKLEAERRRREALMALGGQVLRRTGLTEVALGAAVLAREELDLEVCRFWRPVDGAGEFELVASAGEADEDRHGPPAALPMEGDPIETVDTTLVGVMAPGGKAVAIALHSGVPLALGLDDHAFVSALGQIVVGAISSASSDERVALAERRYRELIERLPVVSYMAEYGPAGKWLYVSPQIERLLGFDPDEWLVNRHFWWSRVHPDDRERVALEEARCAQTLEPPPAPPVRGRPDEPGSTRNGG